MFHIPCRKIANFGDAGNHDYCLCERPDCCPPVDSPNSPYINGSDTPLLQTEIDASGASIPSPARSGTSIERGKTTSQSFLKIFL